MELGQSGFATRAEVAEFLKLKTKTLDRWALEGRGPRYVKLGNSAARCAPVRYRWADVEAWLEAQTKGGDCDATIPQE